MNNQKLSLGLNLVLLVAVIFLFVKVYSGGGDSAAKENEKPPAKQIPGGGAKIAFVNSDSINTGYKFLADKKTELIAEETKARETLNRKMNHAANREKQIQAAAASLTPAEQQAAQLELMQLAQDYQKTEEKLLGDLQRKEMEYQKQLYDNVNAFLATYTKENQIDFVFSYVPGAQLLYGGAEYDITMDVLNGINSQYEATKNK
ncbi:MAG: OmpH family outer membrane protein [Bacteroidota bacterium]